MRCVICDIDKDFSGCGLKNHLRFKHEDVSCEQYVIKYFCDDQKPTCKCGCGQETRYSQFKFKEYKKGHNANRKGVKLTKETKDKQSISKINFVKENPKWAEEKVKLMLPFSHTEEAERKRSASLLEYYKDEEVLKKKSETSKQMHIDHPEMRLGFAKMAKSWRKDNPEEAKISYGKEWRDKISESISNVYLSGGFEWSKGQYDSTKMKTSYYYRSFWELKYMKELDENNEVKFWKYEPFWIKYKKEDGQHRYLPDFILHFQNGQIEIHEVGPTGMKEKYQKEKLIAIKEFCFQKGYIFKLIDFDLI
jgi:hypothetical protein